MLSKENIDYKLLDAYYYVFFYKLKELIVFKFSQRSFVHHTRRFSIRIMINDLAVLFCSSQIFVIIPKIEGF
ncbi:hypothetical protein DP113_02365 [Brasilonema octagenarum UFV-E1]|jgi:hypothetical protein|uniref:Uncharacterized protein n=2 Tax=Brasilonema TaxID=383614 RepID=A0A856M960_9CYAN|nr:hypothetical protein [Brasilonema octagenarum UFV-OR1]QDL06910.1 hypothetical protein DP114_02405 [Brasilonema sennae CENA114]QDL13274.1 hypothetical protein DP113_02365 [Brasilonema octagenarum UFV-E1]